MKWNVIDVHYIGNRTLAVTFADGLKGTVRIGPSYCTGVFQELLDEDVLRQATILHGAITWPNGADLAPDTMYAEIRHSPDRHYEVGMHHAAQRQAA